MTRFDAGLLAAAGDALARPHTNGYWLVTGRVLAGEYPADGDPRAMARQMQALLDVEITRKDFEMDAPTIITNGRTPSQITAPPTPTH